MGSCWRHDFGEFDPFGDFELLLPACVPGPGTVDVPIRCLSPTYGSTNIHRFRHGFQLSRMTLIGRARIKLGLDITVAAILLLQAIRRKH
jgi:hypothetical protein